MNLKNICLTKNHEIMKIKSLHKHDEQKVIAQLINDLGNKSWGKIDFLVNYCGYVQLFVPEF